MILGVAPFAQGFPARAGERQRGRPHEHDREFAEQLAPPLEQALLDEVLDRARGKGPRAGLLIGRELLAQPGHGAIEVMEGQPVHAGEVIVGHPLLAGPV